MSSICWARAHVKERSNHDLRRSFYGVVAFVVLWSVNLAVIFFGWPFLIYSRFKWRG